MCGIPGSGKSTWLQYNSDFFNKKFQIISRDKIRFNLLNENEDYFSKEDKVWKEYLNTAISSLKNNDDTILDATHLNIYSRRKILNALKQYITDIEKNIIVFNTPVKIAIQRNNNRQGREFVPTSVIFKMKKKFTIPTKEEGFDNIYFVNE